MQSGFWQGVGAVCGVLMVMGGLLTFFLRHVALMMDAKLAGWLEKVNGNYVRTGIFVQEQQDVERRLVRLETRRAA